jgi:hypothetical protein
MPQGSSGGEAWPLSPYRRQHEQQQDTPATDYSSSEYFSCPPSAAAAAAVLSPLSPCFTPGVVVFAEDIWSSRASKTSAGKETTTTEDGSAIAFTPVESVGEGEGEAASQGQGQSGQGQESRSHEVEEEEGEQGEAHPAGGTANHDGYVGVEGDYCHEQRPPPPPSLADDGRIDGITGSDVGEEEEEGEEEEDSQAWTSKLRRVSLYLPLPLSHKDTKDKERKRMSLPSLKGMWPQSSRNSIQSIPAG